MAGPGNDIYIYGSHVYVDIYIYMHVGIHDYFHVLASVCSFSSRTIDRSISVSAYVLLFVFVSIFMCMPISIFVSMSTVYLYLAL